MKFALSTNWNNGRLNDGAAIADEAEALGFDSLELGFRTQPEQLQGFKTSKGAIQLPNDRELPLGMVADIARWSFERNAK